MTCAVVPASPSVPQLTAEAPLKRVSRQAVGWLSDYVKIDTSNPPGRELRAARFLRQLLEREGIPCWTLVSQTGRANLIARISGRTKEGGIALVHHMDVVPADSAGWTVPPFSGLVRDGCIWGRGAIDSKGLGIVQLATMIALRRSSRMPERDVVLLAVSDEEMGGRGGMGWIAENRPEWLHGIGYALVEGGANIVHDNRLAYVGVENMQKAAVWLRLTAAGESGHGSYLNTDAASHRLIRALDRLLRYQPGVVVTPAVGRYFREIAPFQAPEIRERLLHPEDLRKDPDGFRRLDPLHQPLVRNTISVTVIRAGRSTNTVPGTASAELDCRLVPTQDPGEFIQTLTNIVGDSNIAIEPILTTSSTSSPSNTDLFEAIRRATQSIDRQTVVGGAVVAGFTDARFLRERGIVAYGFDPFKSSSGNQAGIHGTDERVPVSDLEFAIRYFSMVISEFAFSTPKPAEPNGLSIRQP
jgi:acetylornithine deacetylase/succinyl-diaminopimelate desuccinylase-like protein